jgi:hypothetical protein
MSLARAFDGAGMTGEADMVLEGAQDLANFDLRNPPENSQ